MIKVHLWAKQEYYDSHYDPDCIMTLHEFAIDYNSKNGVQDYEHMEFVVY